MARMWIRCRCVGQADRPPVAAVGPLLLDRDAAPEVPQTLRDRVRRDALSLRGGRAIHRRQLVDRRAPVAGVLRVVCHGLSA
jgi:hypothetical protein